MPRLKQVTIAKDLFDPSSWVVKNDVESITDFLKTEFDTFPKTAKIYCKHVSRDHDVTPRNEIEALRLDTMEGPFYVVVYPGVVALPYIFALVLAVASYALAPSPPRLPPAAVQRATNGSAPSPNNELSDRKNVARPNGRIPDIYGTVRSTPDLIAAPYKIFENNKEVEYTYMCIGRGEYVISDIRDGDTLVTDIPGISLAIYGPYQSPNSTVLAPQQVIGTPINAKTVEAKRSNSVNGQVLRPPNTATLVGNNNIRFRAPNIIEAIPGSDVDFTKLFVDGDVLTVTDATVASGGTKTERLHINWYARDWLGAGTSPTDIRDGATVGSPGFKFYYGSIYFRVASEVIPDGFNVGDTLVLSHVEPSGVYFSTPEYEFPPAEIVWNADLDGTYEIEAVIASTISYYPGYSFLCVRFVDPVSVNSNWAVLDWAIPATALIESAGGLFNQSNGSFPFDITSNNSITTGYDLSGTYNVLSVTTNRITLSNPVSVNSDWGVVVTSPYMSATLSTNGVKWVGPFILEDPYQSSVYANFVASNGLYSDDGTTQSGLLVRVTLEVTPVDETDTPTDSAQFVDIDLVGSNSLKETVAVTAVLQRIVTGRCKVRAARKTDSKVGTGIGTVVDEVRWRDVYSIANVSATDFGNITTVHAVTYASASTLAVKERKINMLVQRKIPARVSGNTFTETLTGTNDAASILAAVCRDKYIGNRPIEQLDIDSFFDNCDAIQTYFGTAKAREFCYTFDNQNLSFEETVNIICDAIFCVAYRRGNVIKISPEFKTDISTLLFNHRNKIPDSEKRSITFGNNDNDGIQYIYTDPVDDSLVTIYLPLGYAAINPKKIESIGVRNRIQSYFHAWRFWNKIRYQNTVVQFDALPESSLLVKNDRILVADGTRPYTQDGEVTDVNVLELTLSQDVDFTGYASYVIFLQHIDGTVESIDITEGSAPNKVVLANAPALSLVTDSEKSMRTGYVIIGNTETQTTAFLVSEKSAQENLVSTVKAINYDDRYYSNDKDLINNVVTEDGYGPSGGFTGGTGTGYPVDGWQLINVNSLLPDADNLYDVDSYNGTSIIVGANGKILRSTNGGQTWTLASYASGTLQTGQNVDLYAVSCIGAGKWLAGGVSGISFLSTNDGVTWDVPEITIYGQMFPGNSGTTYGYRAGSFGSMPDGGDTLVFTDLISYDHEDLTLTEFTFDTATGTYCIEIAGVTAPPPTGVFQFASFCPDNGGWRHNGSTNTLVQASKDSTSTSGVRRKWNFVLGGPNTLTTGYNIGIAFDRHAKASGELDNILFMDAAYPQASGSLAQAHVVFASASSTYMKKIAGDTFVNVRLSEISGSVTARVRYEPHSSEYIYMGDTTDLVARQSADFSVDSAYTMNAAFDSDVTTDLSSMPFDIVYDGTNWVFSGVKNTNFTLGNLTYRKGTLTPGGNTIIQNVGLEAPGIQALAVDVNGDIYAADAGGTVFKSPAGTYTWTDDNGDIAGSSLWSIVRTRQTLNNRFIAVGDAATILIKNAKAPTIPPGSLVAISPATVATGSSPYPITVSPDGNYAYVGNIGDTTISQYSISAGALTPLSPATVTAGDTTHSITISADGNYAYAPDTYNGVIWQYSISSGHLTSLSPSTVSCSGGPGFLVISPDGLYAFVTCPGDNNVKIFSISSGALTYVTSTSVGSSPYALAMSSDGSRLYVTSYNEGRIYQFSVSGSTLTPLSPTYVASSYGPQYLSMSPDGTHLYAACSSDRISQYSISGGLLTAIGTDIVTDNGCQCVVLSHDGAYAYVVNNSDNNVMQFSIVSGILTPLSTPRVTTGSGPSFIALLPDDSAAFVTNNSANTVSQFSIG